MVRQYSLNIFFDTLMSLKTISNADRGMRNGEVGMRNANGEVGIWNGELEIRKVEDGNRYSYLAFQ